MSEVRRFRVAVERYLRSRLAAGVVVVRRPVRAAVRRLDNIERRLLAPARRDDLRRFLASLREMPHVAPPPRPTKPQSFSYDGPIYIRPVGRGVVLGDVADMQARYIDEVVEQLAGGDGEGRLRLEMTWSPSLPSVPGATVEERRPADGH